MRLFSIFVFLVLAYALLGPAALVVAGACFCVGVFAKLAGR